MVNNRETPTGSQIRDTNRPALIAAFKEDNFVVVDLGIVCDSKELLRAKLLEAAAVLKCISPIAYRLQNINICLCPSTFSYYDC